MVLEKENETLHHIFIYIFIISELSQLEGDMAFIWINLDALYLRRVVENIKTVTVNLMKKIENL